MARSSLRDFAPPWWWGIFRRAPCAGLVVDSNTVNADALGEIYAALKATGFRETFWQIVYPGQIGGLIRNPCSHLIELHVRFFFDGSVYCEIEIGRSGLLHFTMHRWYGNIYLIKMLGRRLTPRAITALDDGIHRYKLRSQKGWPEWRPGTRLMANSTRRWFRGLAIFSDWRAIFGAMIFAATAAIGVSTVAAPIAALLLICLYLIAPRRR
jgi:hypothetical protein